MISKVLQVGCKVTSIRSSEQISSTSLRCPFTEAGPTRGLFLCLRTWERGHQGKTLFPIAQVPLCPKTKEQCPSPIPKGEGAWGVP